MDSSINTVPRLIHVPKSVNNQVQTEARAVTTQQVPKEVNKQADTTVFSRETEKGSLPEKINFLHHNEQAGQVAKKQVGVLGVVGMNKEFAKATENKSLQSHAGDLVTGLKDGAVDIAKGLGTMGAGAWKMTAGFLYDPKEAKATWGKFSDVTKTVASNPMALVTAVCEPYKKALREGRPMEAIGRGAMELIAAAVTTKGLDKISKLAKGSKVTGTLLDKADEAAKVGAGVADDAAKAGSKISTFTDDAGRIQKVKHLASADEIAGKIDDLAAKLHDEWRAPRKLADGSFDPRWKEISKWDDIPEGAVTRSVDGKLELDIANTAYKNLHPSWQAENHAAASHAISVINDSAKKGVAMGDDFVEKASSQVHDAWLARPGNSWAKGGELDVPFSGLAVAEAEKDRAIVRAALKVMGSDDAAKVGSKVATAREFGTSNKMYFDGDGSTPKFTNLETRLKNGKVQVELRDSNINFAGEHPTDLTLKINGNSVSRQHRASSPMSGGAWEGDRVSTWASQTELPPGTHLIEVENGLTKEVTRMKVTVPE